MTTRRDFLRRAPTGLAAVALGPEALSRLGTSSGSRGPASLSAGSTTTQGLNADPRQSGTGLVYDDRYLEHRLPDRRGGEPHPERPLRLVRMLEEFRRRGLDDEVVSIPALADPLPFIRRHHTPEHVASVGRIDVTNEVAELAVGGALGAVDAVAHGRVRNAFCAIRPPGHHANNTGREEGFCFYSNAAITARYAQTEYGFDKVLIVDWDYHHGNATQNAFYDDPTVLFFSAHDWAAYPQTGDPGLIGEGEGAGYNINAHLDCGARDGDMLAHWDRLLLPAVERFRPDFIIVSAGFDSRRDDLLGCFDLSDDVFRRMTRITMDLADDYCQGRIVSLLEGGYNVDGCALAAAAHLETLLAGP